jgi:iron complex outermembrane recepter protein
MKPALVAAAASLFLTTAPVAAQQPATPRDSAARDSVRDSARRDSIARLPVVRVVGSVLQGAGPAIGSGLPARASTLAATELRASKPRLLADAIAREPGMSLYDDLGSASKSTLVARGFTASPVVGLPQGISVFLDGVPVNEPDAGQVNFDLLPLDHVERVEILSGTASLLGPHSLGGAVNLITRNGQGDAAGEIELTGGSYDRYGVTLSHGGGAPRGWTYFAGGGHANEHGWRAHTGARQGHVLLNVGHLDARVGVRLQAFAANSRAETAGSLPLSVYRFRPDSNLSAGDFEDINQMHLALSAYRPVGAGLGSALLWFRQSDAERFNVNQVDDPDVRSFSDNRSIGASADWRAARPIGAAVLGYRVGIGGSANRSRIQIEAERIDVGRTTDIESPIAKLDAYALADVAIGRATFSSGARYDVVRIPFRNRLDATRDTTSTFRRLSPRAGVRVALGDATSAYASAGQSFRAPALIELACADPEEPCPLPFALGDDPPLDPVVATTFEAGGAWTRGAVAVTLSAYRTDVRDDIFLFPYDEAGAPSGSTIDGYFANIGGTRREGVELQASAVAGAVALRASYAVTHATFRVDDVEIFSIREEAGGENTVARGDRLPLVPTHVAASSATVALPHGVSASLVASYTGERVLRGDESNDEAPLAGYWLLEAGLGIHIAAWELRAIVRNLLDMEHATFGTFNLNQGDGGALERFLTPGTPRMVQVVVRRGFGT